MISANTLKKMTPEQRKRISSLGVQIIELKRMALDPPDYPPIPKGLQLAAMFLDFRAGEAKMHHVFLFHAGYKNRYMCIRNNKQQPGLIGWHDAVRRTSSNIRPLINY